MTPKEELRQIEADIERLEGRRREIYRASTSAPESEKVCQDYLAEILGEDPYFPKLKYPIEVQGIHFDYEIQGDSHRAGQLVSVRPAGDPNTYLGVYLGRLPLSMSVSYDKTGGVLTTTLGQHNPTMWIPKLQKIIYGCESWWGFIKSEEDFRKITDQEINNLWYVKAWKERVGSKTDVPPQDPNPPL